MAKDAFEDGVPRWCERCAVAHPREGCKPFHLGNDPVLLCPDCGLVTQPMPIEREPAELIPQYLDAFRYPVGRDGVIPLLALGFGLWLIGRFPLVGGFLSFGMLAAYLFAVIRQTARGENATPLPVDFNGWGDIGRPAMRGLTAGALAFGPLVYLAVRQRVLAHVAVSDAALMALAVVWGVTWLPAMLVVASYREGCFGALNPVPVVGFITKVPKPYALTVGVLVPLALVAMGVWVGTASLAAMVRVPVLGWLVAIVAQSVAVYLPMVMARILGLLVRAHAHELDDG